MSQVVPLTNQLTILILCTSNVHHPTCHKSILSIQLFITSCDTCGFHKCHNWSQDFLITKFLFFKGMGRKNQGLFHLNILDV
jgi:hypothetical protein